MASLRCRMLPPVDLHRELLESELWAVWVGRIAALRVLEIVSAPRSGGAAFPRPLQEGRGSKGTLTRTCSAALLKSSCPFKLAGAESCLKARQRMIITTSMSKPPNPCDCVARTPSPRQLSAMHKAPEFQNGLVDCHMVAAVYDTQKQWPCSVARQHSCKGT